VGRRLSDDRLRGVLDCLNRGQSHSTMPGDVQWMARAWAGVLVGGHGSALFGESAGVLHGLVEGQLKHNRCPSMS